MRQQKPVAINIAIDCHKRNNLIRAVFFINVKGVSADFFLFLALLGDFFDADQRKHFEVR